MSGVAKEFFLYLLKVKINKLKKLPLHVMLDMER